MVRRRGKRQAQQKRRPGQWLLRHGRTILVTLLFVAASVGAGFAGQWLMDSEQLPIRNVQVRGEFQHLTGEQLREAVSAAIEGSFFTVDIDALRIAAEALPWVKQAAVRRVWPDTVVIEVSEQVAAARWGLDELLNRQGELFAPDIETVPDYLPELDGPDVLRHQVMEQYVTMTEELAGIGRSIRRMQVSDRRSWVVRLDNGVELRLGRGQTMARLQRFLGVYPSVLAPRSEQLQYIDLRYANGFSVRWDAHDDAGREQES